MSCKQNTGNYPPGHEQMTEEEIAYFDRLNANMDAMAKSQNDYDLTNFNNAKADYNKTVYGLENPESTGQSRNWNAKDAPKQPAEVCHWMDYSNWPPTMYQRVGETGNLLGEPYVYPSADREDGQVQLGPLVQELSHQPEFSVYVDQDSAVPVGTVWQELSPGGKAADGSRFPRWFRLVQDGESKRYWYQTAPA